MPPNKMSKKKKQAVVDAIRKQASEMFPDDPREALVAAAKVLERFEAFKSLNDLRDEMQRVASLPMEIDPYEREGLPVSAPTVSISLEVFKDGDAAEGFREACSKGTFLIWSGEHNAYWRPDSSGYTTFRSKAGRYTFGEAWKATSHAGPEKKIQFVVC